MLNARSSNCSALAAGEMLLYFKWDLPRHIRA